MVNIDVSEIMGLGQDFEQLSGAVLDEHLERGAFIAGAKIQSDARKLVPVDTGALRLSIENSASKALGAVIATVGPTQPYGREIEFGRPPGTYVSPAALMGWAKRKGLNPYAVSKSIQKKGSPAQPFMFPSFDRNQDNVVAIMAQAVANAFTKVFSS